MSDPILEQQSQPIDNMDEDYDIIVLGTGMKECILSGLMSQLGKKVLHIDKNNYYGAECASLNLEQLYSKFNVNTNEIQSSLGRNRDYCVDLCPKFIIACGNLVKILLKTKVTKYIEFRSVDSNYIYNDKKIYKVPATSSEALSSNLLGIFAKRRFKNFLQWVNQYDRNKPETHQKCNIDKQTSNEIFDYWALDTSTKEFLGHAIGVYII